MDFLLIGQRIQQERKNRKLTQAQLAELSGITDKYLSNIETGKDQCSLNTLLSLANSLNVSIDYLLDKNLDNNRNNEYEKCCNEILSEAKNLTCEQQKYVIKFMQFLRQNP